MYQQYRLGRANLSSGVSGQSSLARRQAGQVAARQARKDAAMILNRARVNTAIPRSIPGLRRPGLSRTGGYSFRGVGGKELQFVDTTSFADATTTGDVVLLNGLTQGTTASTRIGRKINMVSLQLKMRFQQESLALVPGTHVFWAIVYDSQTNAATPAYTDIFDAVLPTALRNISNAQRFRVIREGTFILTPMNNAGQNLPAQGQAVCVNEFMRLNLGTSYNAGSAGTVGDIQTGGLFFISCSNIAAGTADVDVVGSIRLRYVD